MYCDSETDEDERDEKDIVRGYQFAEYHADVYDKTESEVTSSGLDCECLGGGRIEHKPGEKYIKVTSYLISTISYLISFTQLYLCRFTVTVWALVEQIMLKLWRS